MMSRGRKFQPSRPATHPARKAINLMGMGPRWNVVRSNPGGRKKKSQEKAIIPPPVLLIDAPAETRCARCQCGRRAKCMKKNGGERTRATGGLLFAGGKATRNGGLCVRGRQKKEERRNKKTSAVSGLLEKSRFADVTSSVSSFPDKGTPKEEVKASSGGLRSLPGGPVMEKDSMYKRRHGGRGEQ
jgi:hypothetical protein